MVENKYIEEFTNWCLKEHLRVILNKEIFFIDERKTLIPTLQLGNNIFVHIIDNDITPDNEAAYEGFAKSFRPIIVIPKDVIPDLVRNFSRRDLAVHFKINL